MFLLKFSFSKRIHSFFIQLREHELKPGGQQILVTEENKQEYIDLVINYRFVQRITTQMNALKQGFQEILSLDALKIFDEKEVEVK